ncbi:unnamed protein product [marine sediment metagenome]|uniref:Uncharacterized protein n=1 Tax=marine sediment metagenome TaxID=412755 RepID=X1QFK7_9ZZZZ
MSNNFLDYTSYVIAVHNSAYTDYSNADSDITYAWIEWNKPDDHKAIGRCINAVEHILAGSLKVVGHGESPGHANWLYYALSSSFAAQFENWPKPHWKIICEAWAENEWEGMKWTIACIDRMRQLMWDEPFDIQWAAIADEPKEE